MWLFNTKRNKIICIKRTVSLLVAQTNTAGEIIGFVVLVLAPQINGHGATSHFCRERYPDTHGEAAVETAGFGQVEGLALSLVAGLGGEGRSGNSPGHQLYGSARPQIPRSGGTQGQA